MNSLAIGWIYDKVRQSQNWGWNLAGDFNNMLVRQKGATNIKQNV